MSPRLPPPQYAGRVPSTTPPHPDAAPQRASARHTSAPPPQQFANLQQPQHPDSQHSNSQQPRRANPQRANPRHASPRLRPARWPLAVLALVAVASILIGALSVRGGLASLALPGLFPAPTRPVVTPAPAPPPPTPAAALPAAAPRTCSIIDAANAPAALDFHGLVETTDGQVLFDRQSDDATPTASVMKLITATSALTVLGPDTRFTTAVYPGTQPGSVVLVGDGDPTLASGDGGVYASIRPALLADLAADTAAAVGGPVTAVGIDTSAFTGPAWQPSWNDIDRAQGAIAPIEALMLDAGRENRAVEYSPRSRTPAQDAGAAFAAALGASFAPGLVRAPGAAPLAQVQSPPVGDLVRLMLQESDNVIAEMLARHVAIQLGTGSDFAAIQDAQTSVLRQLGVDPDGFVAADGSGLSRANRASASLLVNLLKVVAAQLPEIRADLPRNQQIGTLDNRLAGLPPGSVVAKTGYIEQVYALAGYVTTGGSELTFAVFVAVPDPTTDALKVALPNRDALDAVVAGIARCGTNLAGA